jgi:adenylate cyclase
MREGVDLGGEEVEVTVMFVDIRGFTTFAEKSSARDVVETLNDYFDCVVPVVTRHGGYANKFLGDGLLAVFGAPERRRDHADRSVSAGLELAERVEERYGDRLRIGIGINSGPVVAGTMGGGGRLEFTVIGDAVNTAARVEHATRATGDTMLITQATQALLTDEHGGFVERPTMPLRGKTERVRLLAPRALEGVTAARAGSDGAMPDTLEELAPGMLRQA